MTKHHFLYPALIGVISLFGFFWVKDIIAHTKAEATEQAQKQIQKDADKRIADREAEFQKEKSDLLATIKRVKTPKEAIAALPSVIDLPVPIQQLPDAPSATGQPGTYLLPQEDIKPLFDKLASCKIDGLELTKCSKDLLDVRIQADSFQKEADTWKKAAKGTKWGKFGKALKCAGFSAGGAYLGSYGGKQGAAIGAAGGIVGCSIF